MMEESGILDALGGHGKPVFGLGQLLELMGLHSVLTQTLQQRGGLSNRCGSRSGPDSEQDKRGSRKVDTQW
jgi:hypothetical protein